MRFKRYIRTDYEITDRKRLAAARKQERERDALPLFAQEIAAEQPAIDDVMARRVETWARTQKDQRARRAAQWRRARRRLDAYPAATRALLLRTWNQHRWMPGDPAYLLDMLHSFDTGSLTLDEKGALTYGTLPPGSMHTNRGTP